MHNIVSDHTPEHVQIDAFSIYGDHQPLHFTTDRERLTGKRANDHAAVMVCLDVDGEHTSVEADLRQSDVLTVLERTISALQRIHDRHMRMIGEDQRRFGRCMAAGDWGRCTLTDLHDEPHDFPSQADWEAAQEALGYPRSA